jgi:type 1 fimbria pilin
MLGTFRVAATQQILNTLSRNKPGHHIHRGIDFMRHNRIRAVFFGSALVAAAAFTAAPALAQSPYDGLWSVKIVTKTGTCEPSASSTMTVTDGKVSAAGADVTGSIGREGLVRVSIHGAYANGQLSGNAGSGKWNGASAGIPCSGRWEASRQ